MKVDFFVNGKAVHMDVEPDATLLHVLRDRLGLLGTKEACGKGECGACTVLVDGDAVTSCIYPIGKVQGKHVLTIEGLAHAGTLHPIKEAFCQTGAVQCGYCTPGMILSTKALLDKNPNPTEAEIRRGLSGNICRCTGYVRIVEAVKLAAAMLREGQ